MLKEKKLSIIINAYACSPNMGSEPGMAWNWCVHLAKHCELHIITEGEFRDKIEKEVLILPQGNNMHFYYNPVPQSTRDKCWNQGNWSFYPLYKKWQKKTAVIARGICKDHKIDILHQLNMIGFREPGYLWEISIDTGIPFVWGPVDAKDKFPLQYANGSSLKQKLFLWLKNVISILQLRFSLRVHKAAKQAKVLLAASSNSVRSFHKYFGLDSILMNETGCNLLSNDIKIYNFDTKNSFDIMWVGKLDFRKQLGIALHAVGKAIHSDIRLHVLGGGDNSLYKQLADKLGIADNVVWHGVVSHSEVQALMQKSDLMLFTSVAEGTPHVVLEAIANGLPVVCHDTCGHGDAVNNAIGIKVPVENPSTSISGFALAIETLYNDRILLSKMAANCKARKEELSWDKKALKMLEIYRQCIKNR